MAANKDGAEESKGSRSALETDRTPVSSSAVVVRAPSGSAPASRGKAPRSRPRDSEPPPDLTPYQARLDVEMDDTAISKVRDPSVSISLDAADLLPLPSRTKPRPQRFEPLYAVALGTILGALIVALVVLVARALAHR